MNTRNVLKNYDQLKGTTFFPLKINIIDKKEIWSLFFVISHSLLFCHNFKASSLLKKSISNRQYINTKDEFIY